MTANASKPMEIVETDRRNGRTTLRVTAPWERVAADYEDVVETYRRLRVAGFRSGRAPRAVVEKRFQREIMNELSQRCGVRLGREALKEARAEFVGPVQVADVECVRDMSFRFTVRFYPMPEITLPPIDSLTISKDGTDPKDTISLRLLEQVAFEVPDDLVKAELGQDVGEKTGRESNQWKAAADRVRLMLILKRIARQEGIDVDDNDVERRIQEKAVALGVDPAALGKQLQEAGMRQRLKDMLLAESVLDFIVEKPGRG